MSIHLRQCDERKAAANVVLQLLDASGALVRELRTAFDGFYLFDLVAPGEYTLRVSPEQLVRLSLRAPPPRALTLSADGESFTTVDWLLRPVSAEQGASSELD